MQAQKMITLLTASSYSDFTGWMPYKHWLLLEIAWDLFLREIIIYSCYEGEKSSDIAMSSF